LVLAAALGWFGLGNAKAACDAPYSAASLGSDMAAATSSLREKDNAALGQAGERQEAVLPCVQVVLPVPALASVYRFIGLRHALGKDDKTAGRYFRSALELDPSFEWGVDDFPINHPIRVLFEAQREGALSAPVALEGKSFTPPEGAVVWLDGKEPANVEATLERPHLVQVVSGGDVQASHLIDGVGFPADLVGEAVASSTAKAKSGGAVRVERLRPPAKTPLLIAGGTSILASAGLYAASFASRSSFDSSKTTADLLKYQRSTNALVIASGASLVIGLSAGYVGFVLDGHPGFVYQMSY